MLNPTPHTLETVSLSLESDGNKADSNNVMKDEVEEKTAVEIDVFEERKSGKELLVRQVVLQQLQREKVLVRPSGRLFLVPTFSICSEKK